MSIVPGSGALLVDTSAWIEIFRRRPRITLERLAGGVDRVVTCLPIVQEVLQGFDNERAYRLAYDAMYAMPCVEASITAPLVDEAVDLYRRARRAGVTVRSSIDCLIAAAAARHRLIVVHRDRDYAALSRVTALEHFDIGPHLS